MIAECIIFLATLGSLEVPNDSYYIENQMACNQSVPKSMQKHAELIYEFFDEESFDEVVRIGWCESRGKITAYRDDNGDSGVMQFVSWTWNWVAEEYDLPMWDEWVIMRWEDLTQKIKLTSTILDLNKLKYNLLLITTY